MKHVKFLEQLHMVQLQESDMDALRSKDGTPVKAGKPTRLRAHMPVQVDEWREGNNGQERMRRQRACKLPSRSQQPKATRGYLCNKVKHTVNGDTISCFEIRHKHRQHGTLLPPSKWKGGIRARAAGANDNEVAAGSAESGGDGDEHDQPAKKLHRTTATI
ncbi:hypothetical protein F443_14725 [Phytophthora nicotianae P1569]|uniref:Uncharacterized protein n=1 Tax=Phytophthora nicotianae P1569 TaxID=1317065 RepID=V9EMG6_PHYNI|nr:hypothetical protein F443_14725 [Phytophthora nicotianae P1569]